MLTDSRTGGRTRVDHIMRALPGGKPDMLHGRGFGIVMFTEAWLATYRHMEALAPPPTRRAPRLLYGSYAGVRAQAKPGNVLWDLWQRWQEGDPVYSPPTSEAVMPGVRCRGLPSGSSRPNGDAWSMCPPVTPDSGRTAGPRPMMTQPDS